MRPTLRMSTLRGISRSERWKVTPRTTTRTTAAAPPTAAMVSWFAVAPNVTTTNASTAEARKVVAKVPPPFTI